MARGQQSRMMAAAKGGKDGSLADMSPKMLREQAAMMRKSTPNALRRRFPQMKNLSDAEIKNQIDYMEQMANDPEMREQVQKNYAKSGNELRELQNLGRKTPDQMSAVELHKLMVLQRDLLRDNPDAFWQAMSNNPQMANVSREDIIKNVNQMANMEPDDLKQYMNLQQSVGPLFAFMQRMQVQTNGMARFAVLFILAMFVYWLIRIIFRLP